MAKDFLDEMIDALNELRFAEAQRVYNAVKSKELPPMTMKPSTVMRTVHQVAMKHQVTGEELLSMFGMQNLSADEALTLTETAACLREEKTE